MGYAYTSKREKQRAETKQLKKEEKELNCNEQMKRDHEGIMKVSEDIQDREREYEAMNERKDWLKKLTGVRGTAIIRLRVSMVVEVHCLGGKKAICQCNVSSMKTFFSIACLF